MTCEPCSNNRGEYRLTCLQCQIRLLSTTPEGPVRKAMGAHLKRWLTAEQWEQLLAALSSRGLLPSTPSGDRL